MAQEKLAVEIWSDVVCPWCYLGKHRFDNALAAFAHRDQVQVVWKSFQLMPSMRTDPTISLDEFLAREKGIDVRTAKQMHERLVHLADEEGLVYHFDQAIPANTFDAHRMIHFAKEHGKQGEAEERLFRAYFTEGRNIDERNTLVALGTEIGLDPKQLSAALANGTYADDVRTDIHEAAELGIQGVPFFVLDRKYGVSGAQPTPLFRQALEQAFAEWRKSHPEPELQVTQGPACATDGTCD